MSSHEYYTWVLAMVLMLVSAWVDSELRLVVGGAVYYVALRNVVRGSEEGQ